MLGYPKNLNSKLDYEFVRENFPREKWENDFRGLLDDAKVWLYTETLESKEAGIEDETHKIVEQKDNFSGEEKTIYYQYEYIENPNSLMKKLGYTEKEVKEILAEEG